jgi:hypothetical protein
MASPGVGARNPRVKTYFTNRVHNANHIKTKLYRLHIQIERLTRGDRWSRVSFTGCLSGYLRF